jgi:hypothetical protein
VKGPEPGKAFLHWPENEDEKRTIVSVRSFYLPKSNIATAKLMVEYQKNYISINMSRKNYPLMLLVLLSSLFACQQEDTDPVPDVSDIEVDVQLRRFERDLFSLDTNNMAAGLERLEAAYPEFSRIYFDEVLGAGNPRVAPQGREAFIKGFLQHPSVRFLYDTTMTVYPALDEIREAYGQAFRFFRYYFPEQPVPDVTTFISEYTVGVFIYGDNDLAVGLDFFLGSDFPYLQYLPNNPNFSAYLTRTFNRDHLVAKSLQPLIQDLNGRPGGDRLLDMMIHKGKELYLLDRLMPFAPDSVIMEVSGEQLGWLFDNELEMWAYFLKEDLLYSNEWQDIRKFVEYSPHSPGMPPEAPGRTANFIGWQIVREYMRRHPENSMQDLLELKDAQLILDQSRYKPKRNR